MLAKAGIEQQDGLRACPQCAGRGASHLRRYSTADWHVVRCTTCEFVYLANGIIRRGFIDVARSHTKRDKTGAAVNTFLRHTKRWPNNGGHYLAGEHLAYVIR